MTIKKGLIKHYINIDSNGLSGNYFELNGSNTEAEITNASLDGRTKSIAKVKQGLYDGNLKIYKDDKLEFDSETQVQPTSVVIVPVPATIVYNNSLYYF